MNALQKHDGHHFLNKDHFSDKLSSISSSSRMRIDGVYKSSFCPLRCAQKKAPKKITASKTLHPIKK